jgi:hypothetical protein
MKLLRVKIDGKIDELDLKLKKTGVLKLLESQSISKGTSQFKLLYEWNLEDVKYICYGWYDGEAGFENKHELIPNGISCFLDNDSAEMLLFGDIFILSMKNKNYIDLDVSKYGEVFSILCCGYDECNTSEEEDENTDISDEDVPNTSDEEFIVADNIESSEETYSEEELDFDENEYSDESDESDE